MGWAGGSEVMDGIIQGMINHGETPQCRERMYYVIIPVLENRDWDTQSESMGIDPIFDKVIKSLHPNWEW